MSYSTDSDHEALDRLFSFFREQGWSLRMSETQLLEKMADMKHCKSWNLIQYGENESYQGL